MNLAVSEPAELRRLMQGLITGLEKEGAVYPVAKESKTPVKPKLP